MADYGGTGVSAQQVEDELKNRQTGPSLAQALEQGAKSTLGSTTPVVSPAYGVGATPPPAVVTPIKQGNPAAIGDSAVGATDVPGATAPVATTPPATPVAPAETKSVAPVVPVSVGVPTTDMSRQLSPDRQTNTDYQAANARGASLMAQVPTFNAQDAVKANGGTLVDVMATGVNPGQRVVAGDSKLIGESKSISDAPFEPSIGQPNIPPPPIGDTRLLGPGAPNAIRGSSGVPQYETNYKVFGKDGQQGTMSFTGPNKRVGGGTVSAPDQGNGGTVEGNVAAINRQTAALTSLREAQNPGITTGTGAFAPRQESAAPVDPFARPGDGWGDSEKRYQEYQGLLREASSGKGLTKNQRAAKINAAQALVAPGLEIAKLGQAGQNSKDSLAAQLAQNQAASQDRRFSAETASADRRYATDASLAGNRLTAEQQAEKNKIDAYTAATGRMGVKPPSASVEATYVELMNRRAKATDPKDVAMIDAQMKQIQDYRRANPNALLNMNAPAANP